MKTVPNLTGVPETMLWTLYNRAVEAKRPDRVLEDPESVRIYDALDYDFARSFGDPDGAHPMRALESDRLLRAWMATHPGGTVVSLGEGLDTQALRVDDGKVQWRTVDLPEAIGVRSRFIPETDRRKHVGRSALDRAWMSEVGPTQGGFVIAQGLFMYFTEAEVRSLLLELAERFAGGEIFFDVIPRVFSEQTMKGARRTPHYKLPAMPWGIDINQLEPFLRGASPRIKEITLIPYRLPRGPLKALLAFMGVLPKLKHMRPTMVHARFA
jgi:O-methyltransferase involved in polyketide biosynthesis